MISAKTIFEAMSDVRPGRFYSVDELAVMLRVSDRAALHEQLRGMASTPDVNSAFKLREGASDEFYRRVPWHPSFSFCQLRELTSS